MNRMTMYTTVIVLIYESEIINQMMLYNTLLNSDRLIGCLWSRDIE
jgi:hypothetical protein